MVLDTIDKSMILAHQILREKFPLSESYLMPLEKKVLLCVIYLHASVYYKDSNQPIFYA